VTGRPQLEGRVVSFDEAAGLGEIAAPSPGRGGAPGDGVRPAHYRFHCTQIADGSRRVAVGASVSFRLLPGRDGRWEAADVRPAGSEGQGGGAGAGRGAQAPSPR
jgi:CspA family cold shock protein